MIASEGAAGSWWLTGGHVVDVRAGRVHRDRNVEVVGGRIARLTPDAPPPGARAVALGGRYLLPGLISVHTHLSVTYPFAATDEAESPGITALRALSRARDALHAGITTIRCVHEQNRADLLVRTAAAQGWVAAPRILGAGRAISTTGGHGHGMACAYADGYAGFLAAARAELAAGADHVKIFITGGIAGANESFRGAQMTPAEMRAVVRAAGERGSYVVAHAGDAGAIRQALRAGVRSFEHAYALDDGTAAQMARRRAFLTPTLCVTRCPEWMAEHHFTADQIERAMTVGPAHLDSIRRAVRHAPPDERDDDFDAGESADGFDGGDPGDNQGGGDAGGHGGDPGGRRDWLTIVAGTDYPPGEPIEDTVVAVREMEFLTEAGLSPVQALRAGTIDAARLVRMADRIGAVEPGYLADLIVTDADPTAGAGALRRIRMVVQDGRIVRDDLVPSDAGTGETVGRRQPR